MRISTGPGDENTRHCTEHSFGMEHAQNSFRRSKRVEWEGGKAPSHLPPVFLERQERAGFRNIVLERTIWKMKRYKLTDEQNKHLAHKRICKGIRPLWDVPDRIWVLPEGGS